MLCVVILSTTVGTKYFDSNHMEKVGVASIVIGAGLTAATIAEICLFVGTTALAAYGIYEGYENREEIMRFGKEFIDSCGDTVDGWVAQIVDASGQDYVFGSEALELVQDTEWSVIQGGLPPEGDPNKKDDKDKDKFHIPGDPMTHVAQFTALGATWFTTNAKKMYAEWCDYLDGWKDKDTPFPSNNVLINNFSQTVTDADIAAQWSGKGYTYICNSTRTEFREDGTFQYQDIKTHCGSLTYPIAGYVYEYSGPGGLYRSIKYCYSNRLSGASLPIPSHFRIESDGTVHVIEDTSSDSTNSVNLKTGGTLIYSANFPVLRVLNWHKLI